MDEEFILVFPGWMAGRARQLRELCAGLGIDGFDLVYTFIGMGLTVTEQHRYIDGQWV